METTQFNTDKRRRISFLVSQELYETIKLDAIRQHMTLGQFFLSMHDAYCQWKEEQTKEEEANGSAR